MGPEPTHVHKITNGPVFLYGASHYDFNFGQISLLGQLEEVGPEYLDFFGPKCQISACIKIIIARFIKNRPINSYNLI